MSKNKKKHLPLYGIGPALCFPMAFITTLFIFFSDKGSIPGHISNSAIKTIFTVTGILFIIIGILLFFGADFHGNLQDHIKENRLKTNGSYRFVRNPCYTVFLFGCTGALLIAHNWLLLVLPVLFWAEMTIVLIRTEEKWLKELYGQEYLDYCGKVNRCIPWLPKK